MLVGARLSSPGIEELRYDWDRGLREDDDWILPVNGARSELDCKESSKLLLSAAGIYFSTQGGSLTCQNTIVWIYKILLDLGVIVIIVGAARRCACHHGHASYLCLSHTSVPRFYPIRLLTVEIVISRRKATPSFNRHGGKVR